MLIYLLLQGAPLLAQLSHTVMRDELAQHHTASPK